jgi:hypothetical protein
MGSYFTKPARTPKNIPFEILSNTVDAMNPNQYPTFDKTVDWAKTKHVYSEQICFHEKYLSWSVVGVLIVLLLTFLYVSYDETETRDSSYTSSTDLIVEDPK